MKMKKDIFDRIMELPVLRIFNGFYTKHKPILMYLFFGGLTTVISIAVFAAFYEGIKLNESVANVISWICAVLFAYVTNRTWVFNSQAKGNAIVKEMISFFGGRLSTLLIEEVILIVFITLLSFNGMIVKIAAQVVVLVLNYVISKIFVFRKTEK